MITGIFIGIAGTIILGIAALFIVAGAAGGQKSDHEDH